MGNLVPSPLGTAARHFPLGSLFKTAARAPIARAGAFLARGIRSCVESRFFRRAP
jgi:hypothetical protein